MKYFYFTVSLLFISLITFSQPILYSDFSTFNLGKLSGQNGWTNNSSSPGGAGSCVGAICTNNTIVSTGLTYPVFGSCSKSLSVAGDQDGVGTGFTSTDTGSIYMFMLCSFNSAPSAQADIVRLLGASNYSTACRIYLKTGGGGFYAGVGKGANSGSYNGSGPTLLGYGVPHLLVMKYTFVKNNSNDDAVTLYVDPDMSKAEPTVPEVVTYAGTDIGLLDRISLPFNSSSSKPVGNIGIVKVSNTWSDGFKITGKCFTPQNTPINTVSITSIGNSTNSYNTDTFGMYSFSTQSGNYVIKASKNNDNNKTNGVSSIDAALVQSHILGKTLLNSPYKIIAADVNGDNKVSALDIVFIKRLILGTDNTFTNSITSAKRLWVFIDSSYQLNSSTNPFPFKDSISINNLSANQTNLNFIGVKLGDVNWDWNPTIPKNSNPNSPVKKEENLEFIKE